jgi:hypothetical protein
MGKGELNGKVEQAMADAVKKAAHEGVQDPVEVKRRMLKARDAVLRGALALFLVLMPGILQAQDVPEAVVSWDVEFFAAGVNPATGSPISPAVNFLRSAAACGQARVSPVLPVVNPTAIRLEDPANAALDCALAASAGVLVGIPVGAGYVATAKAHGATLASVRSAASNPFSRAVIVVPPLVPAPPRIVRP